MEPEEAPRLRPIRFGILGPGTTFRAWQVRSIEALLAQPGVQLGLRILPEVKFPWNDNPVRRGRYLARA